MIIRIKFSNTKFKIDKFKFLDLISLDLNKENIFPSRTHFSICSCLPGFIRVRNAMDTKQLGSVTPIREQTGSSVRSRLL